jgi:hypothetical protein
MTKRRLASIILATGMVIGAIGLLAVTHFMQPHTWYSLVIFNKWTGHSVSFTFPRPN